MTGARRAGMVDAMSRGVRIMVLLAFALLVGCAQRADREFGETVARLRVGPDVQAAAAGPRIWVTETSVWQDTGGQDRTMSCTSLRPIEWYTGRGYGFIPSEDEAAREGVTVTRKIHSPTVADVTVGPPRAPPQAIYSVWGDDGEWQMVQAEIIARQSEPGRCGASEP